MRESGHAMSGRARYDLYTDKEWIEGLCAVPPHEDLHKYFFYVKCASMLKYISVSLFNDENHKGLIGEFYTFVSNNDWQLLKQFKNKNNASLYSYLSRCAVHYFMARKRAEESRMANNRSMESVDIIEELDKLTADEECEKEHDVWTAFSRLNERDRLLLKLLVIDGKSALEAAEQIWPYIKGCTDNWRELPAKRVQNTIAMLKSRALLSLSMQMTKRQN